MFDLKRFRKENKLTQKQLAEYLDVTQGFVSQIEKGASQLPERYISKILEDNLYKISDDEQKGGLNNNSNNNSSLDTLARAIEILVQNDTIKANNMQELIAQNREQTNNISKLVDLLCKSGVVVDNISQEEKRVQSSERDTGEDTAYNAGSANVG